LEGFKYRRSKVIQIRNLNFTYPDGNHALTNVNINVAEGSTVAVVGGNGAGKSTLLSLLVGIHPIKEGEIVIAGIPVEGNGWKTSEKRWALSFRTRITSFLCPGFMTMLHSGQETSDIQRMK
jgi:ABC-type multidrug transport system fused ATPase/permease subunit